MTTPALTVLSGQSAATAARKMERHHVSRLVVVSAEDPSRPIGVIAIADLLRLMASQAADGSDDLDEDAEVVVAGTAVPDGEEPGD
jgi:CBS domain-containing protein